MRRCDSAAMVPKTSELLPEPDTPVNTVNRRFGISTLTSLRLLTRAPWTRIRSCRSAMCVVAELLSTGPALLVTVLIAYLLSSSVAAFAVLKSTSRGSI